MTIFIRSLARGLLCLLAVSLIIACVGTELTVPSHHAGHPSARSGKLPVMTGLASDFESAPKQQAPSNPAHSHGEQGHGEQGHGEHGHGEASAVYTCPMHPEVERSEPGTCPKCGMKLVPKQASP
jgi:hypothetical protein